MSTNRDPKDTVSSQRPAEYEAPRIRVMDEAELLKVFQITSAASSWWH